MYNDHSIKYIVNMLSNEWLGKAYDIFEKNCNDFSKNFAEKVLLHRIEIPTYVNKIKSFGLILKHLYQPVQSMVIYFQ